MVYDIVDATEVVYSLHNIIHRGTLGCDAQRVGLKDMACLLLCQSATLDMV